MTPKLVCSTRKAKPNCRPRPQKTTRGWMARRLAEKRYATATIATRPSRPVYRCMSPGSADHFENQLATLGRVGGNTEGVLDQLRGFVDVLFLRVVQAAEDPAG